MSARQRGKPSMDNVIFPYGARYRKWESPVFPGLGTLEPSTTAR